MSALRQAQDALRQAQDALRPDQGAQDVNPLREGLARERVADPCVFVIIGGTGDLAKRKLVPALYHLHRAGELPRAFAIVGCASATLTDDQYRDWVRGAISTEAPYLPTSGPAWDAFVELIYYVDRLGDPPYNNLKKRLAEIDSKVGTGGNYLFYLAIPPSAFEDTATQLGTLGLSRPAGTSCPGRTDCGWRRLVVEKPFGTDLQSACELNRGLLRSFDEDQIYRIDHYLGKETVQNILVFRFANEFVEPLLNARYVDSVQITVAESIGIESRGAFYERTGALRDIVQNHIMQIIALICMEAPVSLAADAVRDEKTKVFKSMRCPDPHRIDELTVRGQYSSGMLLGERVNAYREEKDVAPGSTVETYVAAKFHVDNWRWAGVPFYVRTGKRLAKRVTEVGIQLKSIPKVLFGSDGSEDIVPNVIALNIQPDEGIAMIFEAKAPGLGYRLRPVTMDFRYSQAFGESAPDAYERLLMDAVLGDASLFGRADAVEATWELIQPILDGWAENDDVGRRRDVPAQPRVRAPVYPYAPGSWGPREADEFIERDGRRWRRL